jgi:hypothetical protein
MSVRPWIEVGHHGHSPANRQVRATGERTRAIAGEQCGLVLTAAHDVEVAVAVHVCHAHGERTDTDRKP